MTSLRAGQAGEASEAMAPPPTGESARRARRLHIGPPGRFSADAAERRRALEANRPAIDERRRLRISLCKDFVNPPSTALI